jgi:hypothetical protein
MLLVPLGSRHACICSKNSKQHHRSGLLQLAARNASFGGWLLQGSSLEAHLHCCIMHLGLL